MLFDFLKNITINLLFVSACSFIFFLTFPYIQKQAYTFNKCILWYLFSLLIGVFANFNLPVIMILPFLTVLPLFMGISSAIALGITTVFFHFINPLEITILLLALASTLPAIFLRDTFNIRNKTPYLLTLVFTAMICQWFSDGFNYLSSTITGLSTLLLGLSLNSIKCHWDDFSKYLKNQERYQLGIQESNLGLWEWNIKEDTLFFDTQLHDILKLPLSHLNKSPSNFTKLIHSDHHESFEKAIVLCLKGDKENFKCDLQIQTPQKNGIGFRSKARLFSEIQKTEPP